MIRLELSIAGALLLLCAAAPAMADEPVGAREPHLMSETAEITSVVDAFDEDDPFDLNLVLGFTQSWEHAKIRRETQLNQVGLADGGFIPATANIASYSSSRSTLLVGADVGLYKDLALIFRVPLILSWSQSLGDLNGSSAVAPMLLADPLSPGGQTPIFSVPFTSPTRSGVDYISAGIDWAIYNQQRDPTKPTWLVGIEGQLSVGAPLHACNANATIECPDPSDYTNPGKNRQPGISPAFDRIIGRTVWSRRFGYVEPYTGFSVEAQFPQSRGDFGAYNPPQDLERMPPLLGSFMLGLEVVPYEHREQYQRLSADFRFKGTYQSPGRDYSELFDALGSTSAPSLRIPNPAAYMAGGGGRSIADKNSESVYFTGITEEQAYGSFTLSASATWQAGQYIKFTAGSAFTYAQPHLVTAADTCTPGNTDSNLAGPCTNASGVLGSPNPDHHDLIDLPGHRFSIDDTTIVDLWVMGVVMF
ncbi:MAG TPA: hypothetical protein VK762_08255 [Polyangiaceae bacterium]|jgi:hypothetical protein|nr:hypothetical protein [Polyangiaceae bacterium]